MSLKIIHSRAIKWIDVINPQQEEINYLRKNFDFDPLDYEDILGDSLHTKIEDRNGYHLIVLLFPVYNRETHEITPGEIDFFVGKNFMVTIHNGEMHTMNKLLTDTHHNDELRAKIMGKDPGYLLYHILESLFRRSFPILDHITKDITAIEKNIFSDMSLKMLEQISLMRRNVIDFRRIMKTHHLIIKRLLGKKESYLVFPESKKYYTNLLEHAENIWDILAIQKETVEALQDANQSLAAHRLNQITRAMTLFSAIFLPATMVMFIFGLGVKDLPLASDPNGFWEILGIAAVCSVVTFLIFRRKKWL